jgi:hypothetical protein
MATDIAQLDLGLERAEAPAPAGGPQSLTFAGLTLAQILIGGVLLLSLIWAMWTTREVLALRQHKVVSVRLGELVNQFAIAEARSGDDPDHVNARTRAFMVALDRSLKQRSAAGAVVLVGEAVVSSSSEDITASIAADVARHVPMPVAQALPPRLPVAPTLSSGAGSVGQAMIGAMATPSGSSTFGAPPQHGAGPQVGQQAGYAPSAYQPGAIDPSAGDGGGDVQP